MGKVKRIEVDSKRFKNAKKCKEMEDRFWDYFHLLYPLKNEKLSREVEACVVAMRFVLGENTFSNAVLATGIVALSLILEMERRYEKKPEQRKRKGRR